MSSSPVRIPVTDVDKFGFIADTTPQKLQTAAWTKLVNMHTRGGALIVGPVPVSLLTPSVAPYAIFPAPSNGVYGVYFGLGKAYGFSAAAEADITRLSSDYSTPALGSWNHAQFHGFGLYNNGVDIPQAWNPVNLTTKLVNLPDWPSTVRVKVLRAYKSFLVGLQVTISSSTDKRMVKWSDAADPGTLPASWDETDATRSAGEVSLAQGDAELVDCLQYRDVNMVYTSEETWAMRFVGGQAIFDFYRLFDSVGLLAQDCATNFRQQQFLVSQDDLVVHNGQEVLSVADGKVRRWFFQNLNTTYYYLTRVVHLPESKEIWIFFPTAGQLLDTVLVWNYRLDTWNVRSTEGVRAVQAMRLQGVSGLDYWDMEDEVAWDLSDGLTWDAPGTPRLVTSILTAAPDVGVKIIHPDNTGPMSVELERSGIIQISPQEIDEYSYKTLAVLRPLIVAPEGTTFSIQGGSQDSLNSTLLWDTARTFVVGQDTECELFVTGRYLAFRITCTSNARWQWHGHFLEVVQLKEGR